jgi:hypothetical protein
MITRLTILIGLAFPVVAAAFSIDIQNDQTYREAGSIYGVYQFICDSSARPEQVSSFVCAGDVAVFVRAINTRIEGPTNTGLRELWASANYHTNTLPGVWLPEKLLPSTPDVSVFNKFSAASSAFSIRRFIAQFGPPSRYLTGQWTDGHVYRLLNGEPIPDQEHFLKGPDFLIYDLPSGHAVALYVPEPPANGFKSAVIIDSKGNLLIPNMTELYLPPPPRVPPSRKLVADPDGKITAPQASGGKEVIGTWTAKGKQLLITTAQKNRDAVSDNDTIWLNGVEYVADILVNDHEIICHPVAGQ